VSTLDRDDMKLFSILVFHGKQSNLEDNLLSAQRPVLQ